MITKSNFIDLIIVNIFYQDISHEYVFNSLNLIKEVISFFQFSFQLFYGVGFILLLELIMFSMIVILIVLE